MMSLASQYSKSAAKATLPCFTSAMKPGTMTHKRFLWYLLSKDKACVDSLLTRVKAAR